MPRYRTIACGNCGFLVLKRDEWCERCGATTPQATRRMRWTSIHWTLSAIGIAAAWVYLKHALAALGH